MKKKVTVHYGNLRPACRATSWREPLTTTDRRRVTCENCLRTILYKRAGKGAG